MNPLKQLNNYGQSVWMDYIRRNLITSGELRRLINFDGINGLTSNPSIFEKAIDESTDYDQDLRKQLDSEPRSPASEIHERLVIQDIQMAADVLRPVYDSTGGADGYASIEVSPHLAHDTAQSIIEARRLWSEVDRPNLMVKIPATREGIPAIEELLAAGINVNVTLMFSLAHYEAVARAFLAGAERCVEPRRLASVASVFVSRVDTKVDRALEALGTPEALALRGKIAIANAKAIYHRFRQVFHGDRFRGLRTHGIKAQRVLWGSTGTKNPNYSDVMYVEELIGADTINTLPVPTLNAFRAHGRVRGATILENAIEAQADLERLKRLDIDLDAVTEELQAEGVQSFAASMDKLLDSLNKKRDVYV
jgi:transaldolase